MLQLETRVYIVNRALKFARQQEATRRKRGIEETFEDGEITFTDLTEYLEQSVRHLESLNCEMYLKLVDFDEVRIVLDLFCCFPSITYFRFLFFTLVSHN